MTALRLLCEQITKIGYSAIERDYVFADVFAALPIDRRVLVAAFTHRPPSYRNAALAVVERGQQPALDIVNEHRALGAHLFFVIEGSVVSVWQVHSDAPTLLTRARLEEVPALFNDKREDWSPQSVQRAKSIGAFETQFQLDFVDLGLLPAIEAELHPKLDRLLHEALAEAIDVETGRTRHVSERALFRAVFRFLAAKILQDRKHDLSLTWEPDRIETILDSISTYYTIPSLLVRPMTAEYRVLSAVWQRIRNGINFQNISADNLAFVYENTLVTPEIRERFGTHSTPRQVAEYVVRRLELHKYEPSELRVYEPFAGASVFLVSALRNLRERLPVEWTDAQRHEFLVERIFGDEIDAFACEVAILSLILADYPMHNGWHIRETDLFKPGVLNERMRASNVILCNPPFEAFAKSVAHGDTFSQSSPSQAVAALNAALDAHPLALGFVLPRPFILERQFAQQRARIEKLYGAVELVHLPDRIFRFSDVESALLIAREPRPSAPPLIKLRSTEVADRDRLRFLETGEATESRELVRPISAEPSGDLWLHPLGRLWSYLADYPCLAGVMHPRWGLRWLYNQKNAWSERPREGFVPGVHSARGHKQFFAGPPGFVDFRRKFIREAYDQEWSKPKIIVNATRLSRGPWRLGAFADFKGLIYSQQFYGLWPKGTVQKNEMLAFSAVINGPVANAFIATHSPDYRFRADAVRRIPFPSTVPDILGKLVAEYSALVNHPRLLVGDERLAKLLSHIDAVVLKAYDLPPRLERELLEFFRRTERPVVHEWSHWLPERFQPFIPLHEFISDQYQKATRPWVQEVFSPLPPSEADALNKYMD